MKCPHCDEPIVNEYGDEITLYTLGQAAWRIVGIIALLLLGFLIAGRGI